MALRIYNTLTRKKEVFRPAADMVGYYTCGPTVYDYAHIGNFRAYVSQDLLKRYLLYKGYKVKHVMNLTDVDDKTIKGARERGISLGEYTLLYTKAFFEDLQRLNIMPADVYPKATEHIKEMVELIQALMKKGVAYRGEDGSIYYSISKFRPYGKLAGIRKGDLKPGARVKHDTYTKESISDFALWKAWDEEDGEVFWETPIGKGRPGWHIECSAMSMKYLGRLFDIHAGGIDLVFPHHQNEIAQSEGVTGKPFVKYWVHNSHLIVEGRKMSKSLGNFYALRDLREHDPMAIRLALLSTHYRAQLDFSRDGVIQAGESLNRLREIIRNVKQADSKEIFERAGRLVEKAKKGFEDAMDDDLNIAEALAAISGFAGEVNRLISQGRLDKKSAHIVEKAMLDFDRVLGLKLGEAEEWHSAEQAPEWLAERIALRERHRREKNYKEADRIRAEIAAQGIIIEDTGGKVRWRRR